MRPDTPKVNSHVTYVKSGGKTRTAVVTANASNVLSLRVGHGSEVYTGVAKESANGQVGVWRRASAY